jgi:hypothetical protein
MRRMKHRQESGCFLFSQYPKVQIREWGRYWGAGGRERGGMSMNPETQNPYDWEDDPTAAAFCFYRFCFDF